MSLKQEFHTLEMIMHPILHNVNEGILITDTFLNVVFMNEKAEKVFSMDAADVIGKHVDLLKPGLKFDEMISKRELYLQYKDFIKGNEVIIRQGLLEVSPNTFACYAIFRVIDSFEDDQLNSLLQSPYEGIAVFDENTRFIWANEVCYKYFKCKSKVELSEKITSLIPHASLRDSVEEARPLLGRAISSTGRILDLVYLPIIRNNRTTGVIVKSTLSAHKQPIIAEDYPVSGSAKYFLDNIVGNDERLAEQKVMSIKASRTISTVLITGESGTGKEIFAHSIHNLSPRRKGPFVKVNCAAVPETLLESELFGYADGAFTGARKEGKPGKFELANNGTIFLDEIADMSLAMQGKLLRVLQEREIERVGGVHTIKVNVRVIAATNQNLFKLVKENKFREDLYYRLNVIVLNLPPLRERISDIPDLCQALLQRLNEQLGTHIQTIDKEVLHYFSKYHWPGNIRELENVLERAMNFCEGSVLTLEHIPVLIPDIETAASALVCDSLETQLEQVEKEVILNTLEKTHGNRSKAARALNIHRSVLYRKMNKYHIG